MSSAFQQLITLQNCQVQTTSLSFTGYFLQNAMNMSKFKNIV